MVSSLPSRSKNSLAETLRYFAKYDYPLTPQELWFWQHSTQFSKSKIINLSPGLKIKTSSTRKQREFISKKKWAIARRVGDQLSKIPFVEAIFVTGSLAMSNCAPDADIDLMIITSPNSLWLTRLLVFLLIHSFRRHPLVTSAPDRICDNLYLDTNSLQLSTKNFYVAHEILQAKCIFDRSSIHHNFLLSNSWAKKYLPIAYHQSLRNLQESPKSQKLAAVSYFLWPINFILFALQYFYMLPKMTTERVSLSFAFFHPDPHL